MTANIGLFDNVATTDWLGFVAEHGLDYRKVADFVELDRNDISKLAGVSLKSVRYDEKIPNEVKDRLDQIGNICLLVAEFFKGDPQKTALWFKSPNPQLGNITPRDMIRFGRYKKLMQFIIDARRESAEDEVKTAKGADS